MQLKLKQVRACGGECSSGGQVGARSVILESDSARVVKALQDQQDRSEIGFIIAEAIELAQTLSDWRVVQVKRECNSVVN